MSTEEFLIAAAANDVVTLRHLLDEGIDPNVTEKRIGHSALYNATVSNQLSAVCCLLDHGADPNLRLTYRSPVDRRVEREVVALMYALSGDVAEALLKAGADVNAADSKGVTSLMRAAHRGKEEVVRVLLDHGADANQATSSGQTASDIAAARIADYEDLCAGVVPEPVKKRIDQFARIRDILK